MIKDRDLHYVLRVNGFTNCQCKVMVQLYKSKTYKQIGECLNLAEGTVKFHLINIYKNLGFSCNKKQELMKYLIEISKHLPGYGGGIYGNKESGYRQLRRDTNN